MANGSNQDGSGGLGRVFRAMQLFRPRTLAQLGKTDDRLQQQIQTLTDEVRTVKAALALVSRRERQLRAILETEYGSNDQLTSFEAIVRDSPIAASEAIA